MITALCVHLLEGLAATVQSVIGQPAQLLICASSVGCSSCLVLGARRWSCARSLTSRTGGRNFVQCLQSWPQARSCKAHAIVHQGSAVKQPSDLQAAEAVAARAVQAGAASLTALLPAELAAQLPAELRRRAWVIAHTVCLPSSAPGACARLCSLWHQSTQQALRPCMLN